MALLVVENHALPIVVDVARRARRGRGVRIRRARAASPRSPPTCSTKARAGCPRSQIAEEQDRLGASIGRRGRRCDAERLGSDADQDARSDARAAREDRHAAGVRREGVRAREGRSRDVARASAAIGRARSRRSCSTRALYGADIAVRPSRRRARARRSRTIDGRRCADVLQGALEPGGDDARRRR